MQSCICISNNVNNKCHNPFLGYSQIIIFSFLPTKKKKKLKQCRLNGTVLLLPCACRDSEEEDFKCFFSALSLHPTCPQNPDTSHPHPATINTSHALINGETEDPCPPHPDEKQKTHAPVTMPYACMVNLSPGCL